jgi:hypothetical protein
MNEWEIDAHELYQRTKWLLANADKVIISVFEGTERESGGEVEDIRRHL